MSEGVIHFAAQHDTVALDAATHNALCCSLSAWRCLLRAVGLVGQHPDRYEGLGFGNLSGRAETTAGTAPEGHRAFVITGSQTGTLPWLTLEHYCQVCAYDFSENRVVSRGQILPSSESLTHAALYDLSDDLRFVVHGHSPEIWRHAKELGVATTDPLAGYGTPEMARAVQRCWHASGRPDQGIIAMGGHQDGVIAFGPSADSAATALFRALAAALQL